MCPRAGGVKKNPLPKTGHPARSLVTTLTELPRPYIYCWCCSHVGSSYMLPIGIVEG